MTITISGQQSKAQSMRLRRDERERCFVLRPERAVPRVLLLVYLRLGRLTPRGDRRQTSSTSRLGLAATSRVGRVCAVVAAFVLGSERGQLWCLIVVCCSVLWLGWQRWGWRWVGGWGWAGPFVYVTNLFQGSDVSQYDASSGALSPLSPFTVAAAPAQSRSRSPQISRTSTSQCQGTTRCRSTRSM